MGYNSVNYFNIFISLIILVILLIYLKNKEYRKNKDYMKLIYSSVGILGIHVLYMIYKKDKEVGLFNTTIFSLAYISQTIASAVILKDKNKNLYNFFITISTLNLAYVLWMLFGNKIKSVIKANDDLFKKSEYDVNIEKDYSLKVI